MNNTLFNKSLSNIFLLLKHNTCGSTASQSGLSVNVKCGRPSHPAHLRKQKSLLGFDMS